MSLKDQVVLVSGANRGIGAATVRELLKAGVKKVYATARTLESLPDFDDQRVVPLQLDVTNQGSVDKAAATASDIDVLLNNAGSLAFNDFISSDLDALDGDMQTNYYGTLRVIRAFAPALIAKGSSTIANVVSVVGLVAAPPLGGYSASKAALHSLTQTLRGTLKASGVTVIGIYPGPIDTDLAKDVPLAKVTPEHAAQNIVRGLENGDSYIFPDPTAQQIEYLWANDGRKLEGAMAG
ncbi:SDR family oxidoreductase [Rhizobium sp. Rhizsp82]|uniref:SDR family oxidoreductase n=1 Tax=Rhizobium sp. Rhizsp82 TaxID=3243057 RepID=UPI0039B36A48